MSPTTSGKLYGIPDSAIEENDQYCVADYDE